MDFRNCQRCDQLFRYAGRNLCPACIRAEDEEYEKVRVFVRDHPGMTIPEVSKATGVSSEKIIRFLRDGRLLSKGLDMGGSLTCDSCGAHIDEGTLCLRCREELASQFGSKLNLLQPKKTPPPGKSFSQHKMHTAQTKKPY
jgi:flagellar operon protein (TIGR03826 family)